MEGLTAGIHIRDLSQDEHPFVASTAIGHDLRIASEGAVPGIF